MSLKNKIITGLLTTLFTVQPSNTSKGGETWISTKLRYWANEDSLSKSLLIWKFYKVPQKAQTPLRPTRP